jgi:hypothetical protein
MTMEMLWLNQCTICGKYHREAGADHAACILSHARSKELEKRMENAVNSGFVDSITWQDLSLMKIHSSRHLSTNEVARELGSIDFQLMSYACTLEAGSAQQDRMIKLRQMAKMWIVNNSPQRDQIGMAERVRLFYQGEYERLHNHMLLNQAKWNKHEHNPPDKASRNRWVMKQVADKQLTKAMKGLTTDATIVTVGTNERTQLFKLYPKSEVREVDESSEENGIAVDSSAAEAAAAAAAPAATHHHQRLLLLQKSRMKMEVMNRKCAHDHRHRCHRTNSQFSTRSLHVCKYRRQQE